MIETTRPPLLFRIARSLVRHNVRGGRHLLGAIERWGITRRNVAYRLRGGVPFVVPLHLGRAYHWFDQRFIDEYESAIIGALAEEMRSLPRPVTLIDCGADIGLISARLALESGALDRIVAFEPNTAVHDVLSTNLGRLPVAAEVRRSAVGDFAGRGELVHPAYDPSVHARFLAPSPDGDIAVERIDDLYMEARGGLVLKIDVEGGEPGVIRGALETIRRAEAFVVALEAHPDVVQRTGIDALEGVRAIREVRDCRVYVAEDRAFRVNLEERFFDQYPARKACNLVCRSVGPPFPTAGTDTPA